MKKSMQKQSLGIAVLTVVVLGAFWYASLQMQGRAGVIAPEKVKQSFAVPVAYSVLAQGSTSAISQRVNYVLTSSAELAKLWKQIGAAGPVPKVDFTTHQVLAVFGGPQATTGYKINVTKIADGATRLVSIALGRPGTGCVSKKSSVSPYELVQVPLTTLTLAHEDRSAVVSCAPPQPI